MLVRHALLFESILATFLFAPTKALVFRDRFKMHRIIFACVARKIFSGLSVTTQEELPYRMEGVTTEANTFNRRGNGTC